MWAIFLLVALDTGLGLPVPIVCFVASSLRVAGV